MDRWKVELKCPICDMAFSSYMLMMGHISHHTVGSSSEKRSNTGDLLPSPIRKRKRSRSNKKALVAIEQSPLPPPTTLTISSTLRSFDLLDLPLKKRISMVVRARGENQFICLACGKSFGSTNALGGHRAHHKRVENKRQASMQMEEDPEPLKRKCGPWSGGACRCVRCGRDFSTRQGLGMHRSRCKRPQPPPERNTKWFDLNELPPAEEEKQMLALPWRD